MLALVVLFFLVLGGLVGDYLGRLAPLPGYGINLLGSLAGIGLYTLLAFWATPPSFWLTIGLLAAMPFLFRRWAALLILVGVLLAVSLSGAERSIWSPYYRITLLEVQKPAGWPRLLPHHRWPAHRPPPLWGRRHPERASSPRTDLACSTDLAEVPP